MLKKVVLLYLAFISYQAFASNLYDLNSPFTKTALIENQYGKIEEREIISAKIVDGLVELVRPDGSLSLVIKDKVKAILPKLPSPGLAFTQREAQGALSIISEAKERLPNCAETSESVVAAWKRYANEKSQFEIKSEKEIQTEVKAWVAKVPLEKDDVIKIDLEKYLKEGEELLEKEGAEKKLIKERIAKIQQQISIDYSKLQNLELTIDWDAVSIYFFVALALWFLILGIWAIANLSNIYISLKLIVQSILSDNSRIIFPAKIVLWIFCLFAAGYLIILSSKKELMPLDSSHNLGMSHLGSSSQKALYLSLNAKYKWSSQSAKHLEVSSAEFLEFVFGKIRQTEPTNLLAKFSQPMISFNKDKIIWGQNLYVLKYPLQLRFEISTGIGDFSFANMPIASCQLGALPLGGFIGQFIFHQLEPSFANFNDLLGIQAGSEWSWLGHDRILVKTPEVILSRKYDTNSLSMKVVPIFKKVVSSQELAEVFASGYGSVYLGKYVEIWGNVVEVSSDNKLGNNLATEIVRNTLNQSGGPGAAAQVLQAGSEDFPDKFWLSTEIDGKTSRVKIKCIVKSPFAYFLDMRGDLYCVGQSPTSSEPLLQKGLPISFQGGRVESFDRNTVEIYGCIFPSAIQIPPEELSRRENDMKKSLQILRK